MPSIRQLRRRIRGVQNTRQITRAMELVASSRLRRAQERVLASRPYAERIRAVISNLAAVSGAQELHPLLQVRPGFSCRADPLHYQPRPVRQPEFQYGAGGGALHSRSRRIRRHHCRGYQGSGTAAFCWPQRLGFRPIPRPGQLPERGGHLADCAQHGGRLLLLRKYDEVYVGYSQFVNLMRQEPTLTAHSSHRSPDATMRSC